MADKVAAIVDKIKELSLVEASELKTALEEEVWCKCRCSGYSCRRCCCRCW
jgi:hypothetical protein